MAGLVFDGSNSEPIKKTRVRLKNTKCPSCGAVGTLKRILFGMPGVDFDFEKYIVGGCIVTDDDPEIGCSTCGWEGKRRELL